VAVPVGNKFALLVIDCSTMAPTSRMLTATDRFSYAASEWAEQAVVLLTTNLPFFEWTSVIPNARLCTAPLDRITDRAHIHVINRIRNLINQNGAGSVGLLSSQGIPCTDERLSSSVAAASQTSPSGAWWYFR
jgi:hypothetical protein